MRNKSPLVLALAVLFIVTARGKGPSQTPQQLIESSRKASDLSQIGPYQLRATVVLNPGGSKEVKGQITVLRDGDLYRSELQLAQYHEVRWVNGNKLYIGRSQEVPVIKTTLLRRLDRLWRAGVVPADAKTSKVFNEKHNHKQLECFEITRGRAPRQKVCFDPTLSALVTESSFEFHSLEFLDYATFGEKLFPTRILFHEPDRLALELKDITVSKASFGRDVFAPPVGAPAFDTCDDPLPPSKVKDAVPSIPVTELRQMGSATVYLYGIIGTDGTLQNIAVEYSPHQSFTESAIDAVKQWRYTPAKCGDKPVPEETETSIRYFIP